MVALPAPTIVMVFPEIVATEEFEMSYVNVPGLFELGSIIENDTSPYFFPVGIVKLVIVGII